MEKLKSYYIKSPTIFIVTPRGYIIKGKNNHVLLLLTKLLKQLRNQHKLSDREVSTGVYDGLTRIKHIVEFDNKILSKIESHKKLFNLNTIDITININLEQECHIIFSNNDIEIKGSKIDLLSMLSIIVMAISQNTSIDRDYLKCSIYKGYSDKNYKPLKLNLPDMFYELN